MANKLFLKEALRGEDVVYSGWVHSADRCSGHAAEQTEISGTKYWHMGLDGTYKNFPKLELVIENILCSYRLRQLWVFRR